jgi:hypothetical protein
MSVEAPARQGSSLPRVRGERQSCDASNQRNEVSPTHRPIAGLQEAIPPQIDRLENEFAVQSKGEKPCGCETQQG